MIDDRTRPRNGISRLRIRVGLLATFAGLIVYLLGADPQLFGVDRSPVTGFIEIGMFLIGLAIICLGGFFSLNALWNGHEKSIAADIGLRLVATGYVIAVAAGMADVFGIGNHPFPKIPYFGAWQALGVLIGEAIIGIGFLMVIPYSNKAFK